MHARRGNVGGLLTKRRAPGPHGVVISGPPRDASEIIDASEFSDA